MKVEKYGKGEDEFAQTSRVLSRALLDALNPEVVLMQEFREQGYKAYYRGEYDAAIKKWQQGLEIANRLRKRNSVANFFGSMGNVFTDLGQYAKALFYYKKVLAIHHEIENQKGEGADLNNIGVVYQHLGQDAKSLSYYEQALAIHREIGDRRGETSDLTNIGTVYSALDQHAKALSYYEQALAIDREIGDRRGKASNLRNIGAVYSDLGQYAKALIYFKQTLVIDCEIGNRRGEGDVLVAIGNNYMKLSQYYEAEGSLSKGLKICEEVGAPESIWRSQRILATLEILLNRNDAAVAHFSQALDTIEALREGLKDKRNKIGFMRDKIPVYDMFIELLMSLHQKHPDKGYDKKSLEIFERKQGRVFLEEIGQSGARNFAGIPDEVLKKEMELSIRLAKLRKDRADEGSKPEKDRNMTRIRELERQIQEVSGKQQAFQVRIRTDYPDYYALKFPKPVRLTDLQQNVLKPGETVLAYNVMEDQTCLWVVNKTHLSFHAIEVGEKALKGKIAQYRRNGIALPGRDLRGKAVYSTPKTKEVPAIML